MLDVHVLDSRWSSGDHDAIHVNIQSLVMRKLSILQVCIEEEYCVNIHVYLQDIIIIKKEEKIHGWSSRSAKKWFKIDQHTKLNYVPSEIMWSRGTVRNCPDSFVN